jgi:8-oxo-dGTP pyrophosphatase MutT (NUDIX family)
MQRYQVFIDEHSIVIGENQKSNQQSDSVLEFFEPMQSDVLLLIEWLSKEKDSVFNVLLHTNKIKEFWKAFQSEFKFIEAAGGLVENEKQEVLFIYRLEKWDLPKGKMEKGETPEESALREVEEECGISNLTLGEELPSTYHIYFYKEKWVLKKTYWYNMSYVGEEKLVPQTEEAITKAVWVNKNKLQEQLSNTYVSLKGLIIGI